MAMTVNNGYLNFYSNETQNESGWQSRKIEISEFLENLSLVDGDTSEVYEYLFDKIAF